MEATKRAEAFAQKLKETFGEGLVSVVLYGSAARGDYREGVSDLNLLVLLRSVDPATLRSGTETARQWAGEGNPPPLMLSEAEWYASADVFPIEYSDMQDAHVVLHGADPFVGVKVDWEHLRLQCEHELKSKQIQLREQYLLLSGNAEGLGQLLTRALPTFLTLFRCGLRLVGDPVPRDPVEVIAATARRAHFDPAPLLEVLRARGSAGKFSASGDGEPTVGYLKAVESATHWLDRLEAPPAGTA